MEFLVIVDEEFWFSVSVLRTRNKQIDAIFAWKITCRDTCDGRRPGLFAALSVKRKARKERTLQVAGVTITKQLCLETSVNSTT